MLVTIGFALDGYAKLKATSGCFSLRLTQTSPSLRGQSKAHNYCVFYIELLTSYNGIISACQADDASSTLAVSSKLTIKREVYREINFIETKNVPGACIDPWRRTNI